MIDQRGYHFMARNPAHNVRRVVGREHERVAWLESSEVWYASTP